MTLFEKYKQLNIDGALIGLEKGSETSDEYYEGHILLPQKLSKWSVYYSGNFWGHNKNERPGKEFQFNQDFTWDDESWLIPSIYVCGKRKLTNFLINGYEVGKQWKTFRMSRWSRWNRKARWYSISASTSS